jgi:hypothetical protein
MHTQIAAGQGKSVHRPVAAQQNAPSKSLLQLGRQLAPRGRCFDQGHPQPLDVFVQHGVFQVVGVSVQLAGDAVT